jgi:hypothetical protein
MSINVTGIVVNNFENITKVTVEVLEMMGTIQRLKDKLIITLPGRYNNIDEDLMEKIDEELNKNGYNHNPTVE